jgi:hypothetical protein
MQRWPRFHGPRQEAPSVSRSMVALMVDYFGGTPFAKYGTKPQRSMARCRCPSLWRTTGTGSVGGTL